MRQVLEGAERLAAVDRLERRRTAEEDDVRVAGIDANLAVVHRPVVRVAHDLPRLARIVGTPDSAALGVGRRRRRARLRRAAARLGAAGRAGLPSPPGARRGRLAVRAHARARAAARADFHLGIDHVRPGPAEIDADAPEQPVREPAARDPLPRLAAVGRLPEPAARTAAVEPVRGPAPLVGRRVERVRLRGIHHQVRESCVLVDELGVGPRLSAVDRLEDAAFLVRSEQVPDGRHVHDVRVRRVHDHARNRLGVFQADVDERLAGVGGLVHPVAERRALPVVGLARAHVEDVRVRRRHRQVANRRCRVGVEDLRERRAVVHGLEDSARRVPHVVGRRVRRDDGEVIDAAAHVRRPDRPPQKRLERGVGGRVNRGRRRRGLRLRSRLRSRRLGGRLGRLGLETAGKQRGEADGQAGQNESAQESCHRGSVLSCRVGQRGPPERPARVSTPRASLAIRPPSRWRFTSALERSAGQAGDRLTG